MRDFIWRDIAPAILSTHYKQPPVVSDFIMLDDVKTEDNKK